MELDPVQVLSALGIGGALGSVVTHRLTRVAEDRRRRIETDRATYHGRLARLIYASLYALIHSDRCRDGERDELAELIQNLSDGCHREMFLDANAQKAWIRLVDETARCGYLRLSGMIVEQDIADYVSVLESFRKAARTSFGPLLEQDRPRLRNAPPMAMDVHEEAA